MGFAAPEAASEDKYILNKLRGIYACIACRLDLFWSEDKIVHCGWPSFERAINMAPDGSESGERKKSQERRPDGEYQTSRSQSPEDYPCGLVYSENGSDATENSKHSDQLE
ncbi:methionine-R-sulfoxide reductase B2 [Tropilaelaps mercedesae]|uniref:Methionine-R-sulfoxide reductase B2 n=1 Tax=Tropilaelaps mercedesae TaxID=418985 RepID=A0A1V9XTC5_9ACAR|nr:methionine-R-sulfoxide reductase B2 [Tropilaelaps mercedesae]